MSLRSFAAVFAIVTMGVAATATPSWSANDVIEKTTAPDAAVAHFIPFQGFLTDNSGNPITGGVSLQLTIYDQAVGGSALWSETQAVGVADGLFDVRLGEVAFLPKDIFPGDPRWLGISVDGEAELPRTQLLPTPYAFISDRLTGQESGAVEVVSSPVDINIREYWIDTEPGMWTGQPAHVVFACNGNGQGGSGVATVRLGATTVATINVPGGGGRAWTYRVPVTLTSGSTVDVRMRTDNPLAPMLVHDVFLQVDETAGMAGPGIAQGRFEGQVDVVTTAEMQDVVTVSITIPVPGYIVVEASGQIGLVGEGDFRMAYQIDETSGGSIEAVYHYEGARPHTGTTWGSLHARRTYLKDPGTYEFRLEALKSEIDPSSQWVWNPILTATFHPTSYGTVEARVGSPGAVPTSGSGGSANNGFGSE